ncbi:MULTISPECIES: PTS sugar transporter subunit IIA [Bacteria]|uniref:PTS sugar transporter subunit IIA n=1 Tax=Bacteria TaxID=2 RepID=UPI000A339AC7|nr:PTS N-acetylgalactosamine IIA subunit [Enterococcus faecium]EGP5213202.1 PTS N-acetylgalactosamine IIA subunit [Enterococcus faecium]EME8213630.1 PTS N-acetylgalactosamine IIA subunit [Enterococcus faecium]MDN3079573.1 PTS N-acetylgalactosamine IIA subunit [Enterococcus faecium]MDQ8216144.1 PTS N-acetylgalactosamine IIA subunit [Enterococcus faecium]MDQ8230897.1 PTS N-acetylgalactosamine IIA subunit [Enterococcus faecium]
MIGCILTGHGSFASGIAGSLEMIAGSQDYLEIVEFEGKNQKAFENRLSHVLDKLSKTCDGIIVASDLLGGTPYKTAMICTSEISNVEVISGVNLPFMMEMIGLRYANLNLEQIIQRSLIVGQSGIIHAQLEVREDVQETLEGI